MNDRLARGEPLNAESPVISPSTTYHYGRGRNSQKKFLPTVRVSDAIRQTLRPRSQWRPYVFRSYFDTQLLIAEARGKIAHDFRVFFMGHKGSIEAKYTTNKGVLSEALEYSKKMDGTLFVKVATSSHDKPSTTYAVLNRDYTIRR